MWPFKKKITPLAESGIFKGFTDWHSHILPGVDDGIKTMEESLEVLRRYEELGFRKVWLTPHIMEDYPNTPEHLRETFESLKKAWTGNVELALAAENMIDSLFEERLSGKNLLPIGDEGQHLLVETSYFTPPMNFEEMLEEVMSKGYFPVLAHPERYRYMEEKDYKRLKDMGVLFQVNLMSLVGAYGDTARKKLEYILDNGMADLTGSDIHRLPLLEAMIVKSPSKGKYMEALADVARKSID